ncbi:phage GP46 family protein [Lacibacterium aquatile]|uniref:Phage GP46 family protein n=1 Tax=Lacibacterium aquatile TaxID=1168082 RepID=A0ABW5DWQ0_9PROT
MADFRTIWRADRFIGDFAPSDGGLAVGCDLTTSVLISLFTHRRAHPDDRLPDQAQGDRRGWWADIANSRPIGSRLWLLSREKQTDETLRRAEAYGREALQWLIADGIASRVEVVAEAPRQGVLALGVTIIRDSNETRRLLLEAPWTGLESCVDIKVSQGE